MAPILFAALLLVPPLWRIFTRVGLNPAWSLVALIPWVGFLIAGLVLGAHKWTLQTDGGR